MGLLAKYRRAMEAGEARQNAAEQRQAEAAVREYSGRDQFDSIRRVVVTDAFRFSTRSSLRSMCWPDRDDRSRC
jgi:hypothetical protein